MKITHRGTPPKHRLWVGTCRNCGSKAEATQSEMTHITHDQREGHSFSWEDCPVCGTTYSGGILFYPEAK